VALPPGTGFFEVSISGALSSWNCYWACWSDVASRWSCSTAS